MSKRPEHSAPPEIFYNEDEAEKYSNNTRIIEIQVKMSERVIELLALPDEQSQYILDIGCGSGLSGGVLEEQGHVWVGVDISSAMLGVAKDREVEGDLLLNDMGDGMPFRAGTFDAAVSISALQWLCNADKSSHVPKQRLYKFFTTLYSVLNRQARAVFQFYPETPEQVELIMSQATRAGFYGGLVVDFPNSSRAKKHFLVLMCGGAVSMPTALGDEASEDARHVAYVKKRDLARNSRGRPLKKSREWILAKKERRRRQGRDTRPDSKYTARKRSGRF